MRWIIFLIVYVILDIYAFQAFKTLSRHTWIYFIYLFLSLGVLGFLIYQFNLPQKQSLSISRSYAIGFFLVLFVPKLILFIILMGEDVVRLVVGAIRKLGGESGAETALIPSRRKFVSQIALGLAAIPFASLLYGMYKGKYNYKVLKYVLYFEDLPAAFEGYRITQISDIHSGSFDNREKVKYGIDLINTQESDAIMFTGDLVNNKATEMDAWKDLFGSLRAKDGVFSVLGNHDYGDYVQWESTAQKTQNLEYLKNLQAEMGWKLLLNETAFVEREGQRIAVVGVENWGAGFKQKGDVDKAAAKVSPDDFKILLSHDPSHWDQIIKNDPKFYHLTMSGHTHGMQFGIEIPGWLKWSPAQYRYTQWAGIYEEGKRYLNVNRGFGYLAYPGRVGIWPEISVIELRKGAKPA